MPDSLSAALGMLGILLFPALVGGIDTLWQPHVVLFLIGVVGFAIVGADSASESAGTSTNHPELGFLVRVAALAVYSVALITRASQWWLPTCIAGTVLMGIGIGLRRLSARRQPAPQPGSEAAPLADAAPAESDASAGGEAKPKHAAHAGRRRWRAGLGVSALSRFVFALGGCIALASWPGATLTVALLGSIGLWRIIRPDSSAPH